MALAAVAVFVIALTLIPRLSGALLVLLSVVLTMVDMLGFMWVWGLTIDGILSIVSFVCQTFYC